MSQGVGGVPSVVRSNVAAASNYTKNRDVLRFDFWYSCAYCSLTEVEAQSIRFEIDHFVPQAEDSSEDVHDYSNLMWCCEKCNNKKRAEWPTTHLQSMGYRYLRPDADCFPDHLELDGVHLKDLTLAGKYTCEVLILNSSSLVKLRQLRERIFRNNVAIAHGLRAVSAKRLDAIKPDSRSSFDDARKTLELNAGQISKELDEIAIIREMNKSPLLVYDDSDEGKARTQGRREFLKSIKAILPHG